MLSDAVVELLVLSPEAPEPVAATSLAASEAVLPALLALYDTLEVVAVVIPAEVPEA